MASRRYPRSDVPTEIVWPGGRGSVAHEQIAKITEAVKNLTIPQA